MVPTILQQFKVLSPVIVVITLQSFNVPSLLIEIVPTHMMLQYIAVSHIPHKKHATYFI